MSLADVRPTYQPMIWRPWLPIGGLSMIAGAPGAGKTLVMTAIAAAMTRGDPLPGEPNGTAHDPAMVGWLSIEEDPEMVIAPRMQVAGAVMERVFLHRIPESECVIGSPIVARMLDYLLRQCRLVVFDSLEAWSGGAELSRPKEARRVVGWLHSQAKERRAAIAAIVEGEHEHSLAERCRQGGENRVTANQTASMTLQKSGRLVTLQVDACECDSPCLARSASLRHPPRPQSRLC